MPRKNQNFGRPFQAPKDQSDEKPYFFSEKFRKSDKETVDKWDIEQPDWWIVAIDKMGILVNMSSKWSEQHECWQTTCTFTLKAEGSGRKGLLIGRGSSRVGSMRVCAYWYSTLTLAQLFPADDADEEIFI